MSERKISRVADLEKAVTRLGEMSTRPKEEAVRDSVIMRFELAFELAWKVLKDALEDKGIVPLPANPKDNIRLAAENGLVDDVQTWFDFLDARNLATHVYDETMADSLYAIIKTRFYPLVQKLVEQTKKEDTF